MRRHLLFCTFSVCVLNAFACAARADVKLPSVLGSHMVLQQGMPVPIWGWADPGERVAVRLDDRTVSTQADDKGHWRVDLEPLNADGGKAHQITVTGKNTVTLEDLLIGEVWIGSGQSNMAYGVGKGAGKEADRPEIRLLQVPAVMSKKPAQDVAAEWKPCSAETVAGFSAVLYHFGTRLHDELKTPIGLINASRGSTPIEQFQTPPHAGNLYNGSIVPLQPVAMRGILWYQGEANVQMKDGLAYAPKMKSLIEGWRGVWGREFPFYFVQIAPLKNYEPGILPPLWEAQVATLKLPRTGMVVTTDLAGNMGGMHPSNKKDVGYRLALWALARDYGQKDLVFSGPLYKSMKVEANRVRLTFAHAAGLKSSDGKPLAEFEVAGADGKFAAARATIDKETIVVESDQVAAPAVVRFAWQDAPKPNLVNSAGLPASPFQTKDWQGGTGE